MTDRRDEMGQANAGAFLGPDIMVPVPMRTLSDDMRDAPPEPPEASTAEPEPPAKARGPLRRWLDRQTGRFASSP
jgi:hypothetical protein